MSGRPGTLIFWLRADADAQHEAGQFYWENDSRMAADRITELEQQLANQADKAQGLVNTLEDLTEDRGFIDPDYYINEIVRKRAEKALIIYKEGK